MAAPRGSLHAERAVHPPRPPQRGLLAELPVLVAVAFVLALLLKTFLVQAFYIPSESMLPTLEVGDRVLVNKVVYELRDPRRGEVVVFREDDLLAGLPDVRSLPTRILEFLSSGLGAAPNERDFIKRVVGLPGETVAMRDGVVYVDGRPLDEQLVAAGGYLAARDLTDFGPVTVPEGEYFMMGDNRPNSADSRTSLGTVEREDIVGRAFVVMWPPARLDLLTDAGAIGGPSGAPAAGAPVSFRPPATSVPARRGTLTGAATAAL